MKILRKDDLPKVRLDGEVAAHILEGTRADVSCSAFIVDLQPNVGPKRHTNPYEVIFVIVEGTVRVEAGGELLDVTPAEICIIPRGVPHTFVNLGPGRARLVNIHASPEIVTDFTEDDPNSIVSYDSDLA